ncbi:AMP-binding protein [uncultured Hydrogenophaga sp.]|uniref:class I adenylate-forming enzyme family protein n=1 Tax=uncultured Hydrogenophaga sp. TaxID=199683 RepID=UPI00258FC954|nr:AMP-binding protein [uncultured Hydrogenophaga sp.]
MNLATLLARAADVYSDRIAVTDLDDPSGRRDITYRELWTQVQQTAQALRGIGICPGERVAMLLGNSWEYVQTFLAITSAGMVAVPMNIRLLEDELLHIVRDSGARLLIAQGTLLDERTRLVGVAPLGEVIARPKAPIGPGQQDFDRFFSAGAADGLLETGGEDLASINYTSGTTGLPKGAMLPHRAWVAVASYSRDLLGFAEEEVTLHTAALTHGSGFLMLPTMQVGGRALLCAKFDPPRVLQLLKDERVTSGFLVPSMIQMLLDAHGELMPLQDLALRAMYYAGSPIDPATLRGALKTFGDVLVQSFAQTEIPMFLTSMGRAEHQLINGEKPHLIRAAGRVVPGVRLRVVDDQQRDVPLGDTGEVIAQGPHMMLGYWSRPEATADAIVNGWLHTGDVGRFDEDGYLYIVDRKKDMIISGGSNVYAREVEETLLQMSGVREVAVIGLPHPKWGEMVTAVLVADGAAPDQEALDAFCRREIADFRRPKKYIWVDQLPRNPYGKVLKRQLRDRFASAH